MNSFIGFGHGDLRSFFKDVGTKGFSSLDVGFFGFSKDLVFGLSKELVSGLFWYWIIGSQK